MNTAFVNQAEEFKRILQEERDSFEAINKEIEDQFRAKLNQLPLLEEKLSEVSKIPEKIDSMIDRLQTANSQLYSSMAMSLGDLARKIAVSLRETEEFGGGGSYGRREKPNKIIIFSLIVIALTCIINTVHSIWYIDSGQPSSVEQVVTPELNNSNLIDSTFIDSTKIGSQRNMEDYHN